MSELATTEFQLSRLLSITVLRLGTLFYFFILYQAYWKCQHNLGKTSLFCHVQMQAFL